MDTTSIRHRLSTRLRIFLIIALSLHLAGAGGFVGYHAYKAYRARIAAEEARRLRELARKRAEEEKRLAALEDMRRTLEERLRQNAREISLENLDEAEFEMLWDELLAKLDPDIDAILDQLKSLEDLDLQQLESIMETLRQRQLEEMLALADTMTKEQIAMQLLQHVHEQVPEFNRKVEEQLAGREARQTRKAIDHLVNQEGRRRDSLRRASDSALNKAGKAIRDAMDANRRLEDSVKKAQGHLDRHAQALKKADAALADAQQAIREGRASAGQIASAPKAESTPKAEAVTQAVKQAHKALADAGKDRNVQAMEATRKAIVEAESATRKAQAGPVQSLASAEKTGDAKALGESAKATSDALDSLEKTIQETRKGLRPAIARANANATGDTREARKQYTAINRALESAEGELRRSANEAQNAMEPELAENIRETAGKIRQLAGGSVKESGKALQKRNPPDTDDNNVPTPHAEGVTGKLLAQADEKADQTANALDNLNSRIAGHKAELAEAKKRFRDRAATALSRSVRPDSDAGQEAEDFRRQTLREQVADDLRERTEKLAADVLAQKDMQADEKFTKALGRKAAEIFLEGAEGSLRDSAYRSAMSDVAEAYGLAENPENGEGEEGPHSELEGHGEGLGVDEALAERLAGTAGETSRKGIARAISSNQRELSLPSLSSFGQRQGLGLKLTLAQTGAAHRSDRSQSTNKFVIDLERSVKRLQEAQKPDSGKIWAYRGRSSNLDEYEKNIKDVMEGRDIKALVLKAPSLDETSKTQTRLATRRAAEILIPVQQTQNKPEEAGKPERSLEKPSFRVFAYGGAPLAQDPPTIDGDLSDWDHLEDFRLRAEIKKSHWPHEFPKAWEPNRNLNVQWNQKGFYFAYRVVDEKDNTGSGPDWFWENDCFEVWVDFANTRSDKRTIETQQFWFWPLEKGDNPVIGGEALVGQDNTTFKASSDPTRPQMAVQRTSDPRGYTVEIFLPVEMFHKPTLEPGKIIAFDYSIHNGEGCYLRWTCNLGKPISETPSLWGDLILLGTDAKLSFVRPDTEEPLKAIVPGEPFGIRMEDEDMNLDRRLRDKVEVRLGTDSGDLLVGLLEETGEDTGIFTGSVDTEQLFFLEEIDFEDGLLQVAGGDTIQAEYLDQARRYGERNHRIRKKLPVGVPVLRTAGHPAE